MEGTWSDNAQRVLRERYLRRDEAGTVIETPDEMCERVANHIAMAEYKYGGWGTQFAQVSRAFADMMKQHEFMPNSPTLMNAGMDNGLQYSACYVLPIEDSIDSIFGTLKESAIIHKSGGGTGFSFSRLRPANARVGTTQGVASGPCSFIKLYDAETDVMKQGGKRRGANMGVLDCLHPDIPQWVVMKRDRVVTNFNISIGARDAFMRALIEGKPWTFVDPTGKTPSYTIDAGTLWDDIRMSAWMSGDPGFLFLDTANAWSSNPVPAYGPLEATNPCGEAWLYPYEACNLGSINLSAFVKDRAIDWPHLGYCVRLGVRFLDNVIDQNPYPLPEIHRMVKRFRRIGLGIMGWHHLLMKLGIPYASEKALELAHELGAFIKQHADQASHDLAVERGPFPEWSRSIYAKSGLSLRNSNRTTIAPTGTISIIVETSSGIEPVFALEYEHRANGRVLPVEDPVWKAYRDRHPAEVFQTAHEIPWRWHLKHQAVWQQYTDNAVSKTINMPNHATPEEIGEAYIAAWQAGCLGITVFRDGCLGNGNQVLNRKETHAEAQQQRPGSAEGTAQAGSQADRGRDRQEVAQEAQALARLTHCPTCFSMLVHAEGCSTCHACGWSACAA